MMLKQPPIQDDLVVTLNQRGCMLAEPEEYNQAFIDYAAQTKGTCLEIGAAYGVSALPALNEGARIIANDLDKRHLSILKQKVSLSARERLTLKPGRFPEEIDFQMESLDAVLASRVLGFLDPNTLQDAFKKIFKWLKKDGKFFVLVVSPFMGNYQTYIPLYEQRKCEKKPWPGLIENVASYAPTLASNWPEWVNLLDKDQLTELLREAGFQIEKIGYSPAKKTHPKETQLDGREHVGAIAFK